MEKFVGWEKVFGKRKIYSSSPKEVACLA